MQRIWIAGSSGSGKTTLANHLGRQLDIPVVHEDLIIYDAHWKEKTKTERIHLVRQITGKDSWIFDGDHFSEAKEDGRMERCDTIIFLHMNRFLCFARGIGRTIRNMNKQRTDIPANCENGYSIIGVYNILYGYSRGEAVRQEIFAFARQKGIRVFILRGKKDVREFCSKHTQTSL